MLLASLLYPPQEDYLRYGFLLFWVAILAVSLHAIAKTGRDFVQRPRLVDPISGRSRPFISTY